MDDFEQLTATAMPWEDTSTGWIYSDGSADYLNSLAAASAWDFLHNGNGMTTFSVVNPHTVGGGYFFGNTVSTANIGFLAGLEASNKLRVVMSNGSAFNFDQTSAVAALAVGSNYVIDISWKSGGNLTAYVNGTSYLNVAVSGETATSAPFQLTLGASKGYVPFKGSTGEFLAFSRTLSLTERTRLRTKLAAKHSITLS